MKSRALITATCVCLIASPLLAHAQAKTKPAPATAAKPKAAAPAQPAMDPKAMEEMMAKASALGPQHEGLKKLVGEWNVTVSSIMDPSQPPVVTKGTSVVTSLMDGRYVQEQATGEMMGKPFLGMGVTGYDNILKKYVSSWIDNGGTGIMMSTGTADATGNVITWHGQASDPMTGKMTGYRMVSRWVNDNQRVFEMYGAGPDGKEAKMMEITYDRKV